jgi:hydroxymethylglutaryl-CoA reductase (NADPH)
MTDKPDTFAQIPMENVGPIKIRGPVLEEEVMVPLATLESPLWPSTNRGAKVSTACDGISVVVAQDCMTRSILLQAETAEAALEAIRKIEEQRDAVAAAVAESSNYGRLTDLHFEVVGNLLYIRISLQTGDAAGHNMTTWAADHVIRWLEGNLPELQYVSISGNYCTDKKASAINGILGRGRRVVAEIMIPEKICGKLLKTSPEKITDLNVKKNLLGTSLAGGVRTANAHFANILLGFYLATGQDAANIVEGSQGYTFAEARDGDLYFSVTLPSLVVGSIGSGKDLPYVESNLEMLGCRVERAPGENARRLAAICGAAVLCGELSLMAALTNPGELMRAHRVLERGEG